MRLRPLAAGAALPGVPDRGRALDRPAAAGAVWSVAVYEHAYHPAFRDELPYACALVELDGGPTIVSRLVDVDPAEAEVGMRVEAVFPEVAPTACGSSASRRDGSRCGSGMRFVRSTS